MFHNMLNCSVPSYCHRRLWRDIFLACNVFKTHSYNQDLLRKFDLAISSQYRRVHKTAKEGYKSSGYPRNAARAIVRSADIWRSREVTQFGMALHAGGFIYIYIYYLFCKWERQIVLKLQIVAVVAQAHSYFSINVPCSLFKTLYCFAVVETVQQRRQPS